MYYGPADNMFSVFAVLSSGLSAMPLDVHVLWCTIVPCWYYVYGFAVLSSGLYTMPAAAGVLGPIQKSSCMKAR